MSRPASAGRLAVLCGDIYGRFHRNLYRDLKGLVNHIRYIRLGLDVRPFLTGEHHAVHRPNVPIDDAEETFLSRIREEMEVSKKVAAELLKEYRTLFGYQLLGDNVFSIRGGGNPAKAYDRYMRRVLLHKLIEELLAPRELNLVKSYLGIGMPKREGMTFQELAVRLNYNDPSGAEKAYKKAIQKIQDNLNAGEYGRWVEIQQMIRLAQRNGPVGETKDRTDTTATME